MSYMLCAKSVLRVTRRWSFSATTTAAEDLPHFPFKRPHGAEPPLEFAKLRKECPVSKVSIVDDRSWAWLLTKHADILKVLSDNVHFSKMRTRTNCPELTEGGRLAASSRNMAAPTFTSENIKTLVPMIQNVIDKQIREMKSSTASSVDLIPIFALPVASNVMYIILGIPTEDMPFLAKCDSVRTNGSATAAQASAANQDLVDYLRKLIEEKAKHPTEDDQINTLIREQLQTNQIALDELVQMVFLMLVAGNAMLVNMIALGVSTILQHPKQLAELQANPALYKNAAVELCRFHTASALATRRVAIKDVVIHNQLIKAGEGVIAATQSGNRDPDAFSHPDRFDIYRTFNDTVHKSLAYGHGEHECIAEHLALTELELSLRTLFEAFPKLRLAVNVKEIKYSAPECDLGIVTLPVTWNYSMYANWNCNFLLWKCR